MNYWLVKTDPETYSWDDFSKDKITSWDGIRNFAARLHLKAMKKSDRVLVYHSGGESAVMGTAVVTKMFYPDPTAEEGEWYSVELKKEKQLKRPVTLKEIRQEKKLKEMLLIKISRLSVMPVTEPEFTHILEMGEK
jgi:predicted RNA-binding protein with PUA-like domain